MKIIRSLALTAAVMLGSSAGMAQAAPTTVSFVFGTGPNFGFGPNTAVVRNISASGTLTYDFAAKPIQSGLLLDAFDLRFAGNTFNTTNSRFEYFDNFPGRPFELQVYGLNDTIPASYPQQQIAGEDFSLILRFDETRVVSGAALLATGGFLYFGDTSAGPAAGAPAAVPEPGPWALMIGGFGLLGWTLRRRKTSGMPQPRISAA